MYVLTSANISDWKIIRSMAEESGILDIHTPYTYYLMCLMFHDQIFIIRDDQCNIIGYIMSIKNDDYVFIWQIYIKEQYRHKGISKYLYDAVFMYSMQHNYNRVLISIDSSNTTSYNALLSYCNLSQLSIKLIDKIKIELIDFAEYENLYEIII